MDVDQPLELDKVDVGSDGPSGDGAKVDLHPQYLDTLLRYYEEEVVGEASFDALAGMQDKAENREKLRLLAEVENYAAASVLPLVRKYGLKPRSEATMFQQGRDQASKGAADWAVILAKMDRTILGYIDDFKRLEAMAPPEDLPRLKVLTAHEAAAVEFIKREYADAPDRL